MKLILSSEYSLANSAKEIALGVPFVYKHLGSMATIGRYKALVDLRESKVTNI